jgi:NAD(P)-dependent dehydrogenase (short-subunit alcohol dehydrogenase family)
MGIKDFYLTNKVAFIAGGRRGIGKAIAKVFAEVGADVAVGDVIADSGELEATVEQVRKLGRRTLALQFDITKQDSVEKAIQRVVDELGGIDILINTAAESPIGTLIDLSETDWDAVIDTHVKGYFFTSQTAAKRMIEQGKGGSIVSFSSRSYLRPRERMGAYGTAKAAVVTLTGQLAMELGPYNIRANAIAPSTVMTEGAAEAELKYPENRKFVEAETALGRISSPEEIANVALFLASDAASYVSGVTILVDGASIWMGAKNPPK